VLLGDYLCHKDIYAAVQAFLAARYAGGAGATGAAGASAFLRLLDLGCGDAHCISGALEASGLAPRVAAYTGVDMSAAALALARANLGRSLRRAPAGAEAASFHNGDMVEFITSAPAGGYDVVFASLSLHHLPLQQKRAVLRAAARALAPGGAFVLVDVFYKDAGGWGWVGGVGVAGILSGSDLEREGARSF
jgi:SAM-dependent methyltransferase